MLPRAVVLCVGTDLGVVGAGLHLEELLEKEVLLGSFAPHGPELAELITEWADFKLWNAEQPIDKIRGAGISAL